MPILNTIPTGIYCYKRNDGQTYICPYWKRHEVGAYCSFLDIVSEKGDPYNLIWDQCKECGEKVDYEGY